MLPRNALVTGANRGIGFEICRQLAKNGINVILSCRNKTKGLIAVQKLKQEGLEIDFHQLDVADIQSINSIVDFIKKKYNEKIDILINNAGIALHKNDSSDGSIFKTKLDTIRTTMETNTYGPLLLCQTLVPFMKKNNYGRIINISSGLGQLSEMSGKCTAYRFSKVCLNALTRILNSELAEYNLLVNSMCPGWVRTDMGGANATKSTEEGAETAIWLATLPDNGPRGLFFRDKKPIPW